MNHPAIIETAENALSVVGDVSNMGGISGGHEASSWDGGGTRRAIRMERGGGQMESSGRTGFELAAAGS